MSHFQAMLSPTPFVAGNASYVEATHERFLAAPNSVEPKWREFCAGLGGRLVDDARPHDCRLDVGGR